MLGDFVGHGLSAAIGGLPVASVFYATARKDIALPEVVMTINESLRATLPHGFFCSAVLLECSAAGDRLRCWNAGMPAVLLRSAASTNVRQVPSHCVPLGVVPSQELQTEVNELSVSPGDRVICMSDGIVEALNPDGELFGMDRIVRSLSHGSPADAFDSLLSKLAEFRGTAIAIDDLSLIEVTMGMVRRSGSFPALRP
jgi:serine phosphatase RsbU (regulator of sigma subunit)